MYSEIVKFIKELYGTDEFIPLHEPKFFGNEKKYVLETIDSTFVSSVGKFVDSFEIAIEKYTKSKKAVAVVNGTAGLHLALVVVGVEAEHEVLTQALSFVATTNAIQYTGASPVFIDVDRENMGMSAKSLQLFLETETELKNGICINKKTGKQIKACVPMHSFGFPCEIDAIVELCKANNITVVEDAAESIGSTFKGQHTGTFGEVGVFSFNGNKTITSGGGGVLVFQNEELAARAKFLSTTAKEPHKWAFKHNELGYNYRMPNLNAALALAQLEKISEVLERKRILASKYEAFFKEINGVEFKAEEEYSVSNYWLNTLVFESEEAQQEFLGYSNQNNVMTRPSWDLLNTLPMNSKYETTDLSNSIWLSDRIVNIPSSCII